MAQQVRKRRKAERPTEILQAALEEFTLNGFAGTRLDDVAARAGITKGTIYVYFPSKEDLFIATLKEKTRPVFEHLQTLAAEADGPAIEILRRHLAFVAEHLIEDSCGRDIFHIMLAEGHRFPSVVDRWSHEMLEPAIAALSSVLRHGVERGEFHPDIVGDFPQLVMAPIILHNAWQGLFADRRPLDVRRFFDAAMALLAHGLLVRDETSHTGGRPEPDGTAPTRT